MTAKYIIRNGVAGLTVLVFLILLLTVVTRYVRGHLAFTLALCAVLGVLGLTLVILTLQIKDSGWRRAWLLLMGCAAAGIPLCIVLHTVVYSLVVKIYGEGAWGPGGDEPVLFVIGVLVLPVVFVIAAIGSALTFWRSAHTPSRRRTMRH